MMEWINDYFSRSLDFAGEEDREHYKKICIIAFVGRIILDILFRLFIMTIPLPKAIFAVLAFGGGPVLAIMWLMPLFAATYRRCIYARRSRYWFLLGLLKIGPLILWFFLGREKKNNV